MSTGVDYRLTLQTAIDIEAETPAPAVAVKIRFEPDPAVDGLVFAAELVPDSPMREFAPAIRAGLDLAIASGRGGMPFTGIRATLVFGWAAPAAASPARFAEAARRAFGYAAEGNRALLEPEYGLVVRVPERLAGDTIGAITGSGGTVELMEQMAGAHIRIAARVFATDLPELRRTLAAAVADCSIDATSSGRHRLADRGTLLRVLAERDALGAIAAPSSGPAPSQA